MKDCSAKSTKSIKQQMIQRLHLIWMRLPRNRQRKNYQTLMTKRSLETDKGKSEASHPKPVFVLESMSTMRLTKPSQFQNLEHMAPHPLVLLMPS